MNIVFSGTLLRFVGHQKQLKLEAQTVGEAIIKLTNQYPPLKQVLYDSSGKLRTVHRLFLNQQPLALTDLEHKVGAEDNLEFVTALAGG